MISVTSSTFYFDVFIALKMVIFIIYLFVGLNLRYSVLNTTNQDLKKWIYYSTTKYLVVDFDKRKITTADKGYCDIA